MFILQDDMNLTDDKKQPLRMQDRLQKEVMLNMHFKSQKVCAYSVCSLYRSIGSRVMIKNVRERLTKRRIH